MSSRQNDGHEKDEKTSETGYIHQKRLFFDHAITTNIHSAYSPTLCMSAVVKYIVGKCILKKKKTKTTFCTDQYSWLSPHFVYSMPLHHSRGCCKGHLSSQRETQFSRSCHPKTAIAVSLSSPPLSPSVTPALFHSRLKHVFHNSFSP